MFKRLEKKLKRKKEEEELGIDEDMKDIMGLNDTDTDESDSDSDEESSVEGEFHGIEDVDDEVMGEDEVSEEEDEQDEQDGEQEERDLITIAEALKDPIYLVSLEPETKECIVCQGKQLKGAKMVETHKSSNAHERRFKQFQKLAASADPKSNAHELLAKALSEIPVALLSSPSGTSKRAEKRRIAKEKRKAKREKAKARAKTKKDDPQVQTIPPSPTEAKKSIQNDGKSPSSKKTGKKMITSRSERNVEKEKKEPKEPGRKDTTKQNDTKGKQTKRSDNQETIEPRPKKKRKTDANIPAPVTTKTSVPSQTRPSKIVNSSSTPSESPELVRELQSQVHEIIKSASDLAKAARLRALGGDTADTSQRSKRKPSKKGFPLK